MDMALRVGPQVVVKLGGSLMTSRERLLDLLEQITAAEARPVIIPGGGIFADAVRAAQATLGFSDHLAHRLALDGMAEFAEVLCELNAGLTVVADFPAIASAHAEGRTPVWTPAMIRAGHPQIPETWDVTSDSLAAFVAAEVVADALVLVKSGDLRGGLDEAIDANILDPAFPAFLERYSGIVRILGSNDHRRLGQAIADPTASIGQLIQTRP